MRFTVKLVTKYQDYMFRQYKVAISDSQAQLDLESLSGLYLAFTKSDGEIVQKQSLK